MIIFLFLLLAIIIASAEVCKGSATTSTIKGFDCMKSVNVLEDAYTIYFGPGFVPLQIPEHDVSLMHIHWAIRGNTVHFIVRGPTKGYVALAWARYPGAMIGSTAVIGWMDDRGVASIGVYDLNGKIQKNIQYSKKFNINKDAQVVQNMEETAMYFSVDKSLFQGKSSHPMLAAYSQEGYDSLKYHGNRRVGFYLSI